MAENHFPIAYISTFEKGANDDWGGSKHSHLKE
jgi:hypothetical protein